MRVSDPTGGALLGGFGDVGLTVFNMSADDLVEIKVRTLGVQSPTLNTKWLISVRTTTLLGTPQSCPGRDSPLSTFPASRNPIHTKPSRGCNPGSHRSFL